MRINLATSMESEEVLHVLNEATVDLMKKEIDQWSYPWNKDYIDKEVQNHNVYVLIKDYRIIGTFFLEEINRLSHLTLSPNSFYLSKIALLPEFQGKKLGAKLINYACSYAKELNKSLYLDCWSGNIKLRNFYSRNGFMYMGDFPEEDYFISVFKYSSSSCIN
ncbi:Acetyltransferase (GNAT) family protein [Salinibacillus kushneri]|uniref:Acetyltransferase (GNAT) family protein n=1 Tax=Salinibacillus kushneri TaxID=237682 RepID=A0A1I0F379_9BACI|nr:GNAT family N-acetyltransferase [Salinibacillus kushneri]SET52480.1 Acetyltransferase (GNAT) family protein [Salinibacillus kushneri]